MRSAIPEIPSHPDWHTAGVDRETDAQWTGPEPSVLFSHLARKDVDYLPRTKLSELSFRLHGFV